MALSTNSKPCTVIHHLRPAGIIFSFHFYSKVTEHKAKGHSTCAGIIRMQVLFKGGPYMRKYGM